MSRWIVVGLVLAGIVLVVVGAGLEWSRITLDGREISTESGFSLQDGDVTVAIAAAAGVAVALWAGSGRRGWAGLGVALAGVLVVGVAVRALLDVRDRPGDIADQVTGFVPRIESFVGPGLWLTLAGGGVLVAAGVLAVAVRARRS